MQYLFESWSQAAEDWKKSTVYVSVCEKTGTIRRGVRKWVTKAQLVQSVGVEVAEAIIAKKMSCEVLRRTEVRTHPDAEEGTEARPFVGAQI